MKDAIAKLDSKTLLEVFCSYEREICLDNVSEEEFWKAVEIHGLLRDEILKRCDSSRRV